MKRNRGLDLLEWEVVTQALGVQEKSCMVIKDYLPR
jgi:hypothetical protein